MTYLSNELECSGGTEATTFFHAVQLGIECDGNINFSDTYVECGAQSHQFAKLNDFFEVVGPTRWTCAELVEFSPSQMLAAQVFPDVSIVTDDLWLTSAPDACLEQVSTDVIERESASDTSSGAIAGVIIGAVAIALVAMVFFVRRNKSKRSGDTVKEQDLTYSEDMDDSEKEMELAVRKSVPA